MEPAQITELEINSLVQIIEAMPTNLQMSWVAAVKRWNETQIFRDDIYASPKKGGESYAEVKSLRDHFNEEMKAPKVEPKAEQKAEEPAASTTIKKCPVCGGAYVNLNQHITKKHGDWKPGQQSEYEVVYTLTKDDDEIFIHGYVNVNGKKFGEFDTEASGKTDATAWSSINKELGGQFKIEYHNGKMKLEKYETHNQKTGREIKGAKFVKR